MGWWLQGETKGLADGFCGAEVREQGLRAGSTAFGLSSWKDVICCEGGGKEGRGRSREEQQGLVLERLRLDAFWFLRGDVRTSVGYETLESGESSEAKIRPRGSLL